MLKKNSEAAIKGTRGNQRYTRSKEAFKRLMQMKENQKLLRVNPNLLSVELVLTFDCDILTLTTVLYGKLDYLERRKDLRYCLQWMNDYLKGLESYQPQSLSPWVYGVMCSGCQRAYSYRKLLSGNQLV